MVAILAGLYFLRLLIIGIKFGIGLGVPRIIGPGALGLFAAFVLFRAAPKLAGFFLRGDTLPDRTA